MAGIPTNIGNDISFNLGVELSDQKSVEDVLKIKKSDQGTVNDYGDGSTIIINSDRLILNSKKDYLMMCGTEGLLLSSPKSIHIDCDDDIYIFSNTELYLGLPNKGEPYDFGKSPVRKTKADPTPDSRYEPLVLGIKLSNWLDDLTVLLQQTVVTGQLGSSAMTPEMIENFKALQARIPEMISTYAFIDGVSHQPVKQYQSSLGTTSTSTSTDTNANQGSTFGASFLPTSLQPKPTTQIPLAPNNNAVGTSTIGPGGTTPTNYVMAISSNPSIPLNQPSTNPDGAIGESNPGSTSQPQSGVTQNTQQSSNTTQPGSGWAPPPTQTPPPPPQHILVDVASGMSTAPLDRIKKLYNEKGKIQMWQDSKDIVYTFNQYDWGIAFYQRKNDLSGGRLFVNVPNAVTGGLKTIKGSWRIIPAGSSIPANGVQSLELSRDDGKIFYMDGYTTAEQVLNKFVYTT